MPLLPGLSINIRTRNQFKRLFRMNVPFLISTTLLSPLHSLIIHMIKSNNIIILRNIKILNVQTRMGQCSVLSTISTITHLAGNRVKHDSLININIISRLRIITGPTARTILRNSNTNVEVFNMNFDLISNMLIITIVKSSV